MAASATRPTAAAGCLIVVYPMAMPSGNDTRMYRARRMTVALMRFSHGWLRCRGSCPCRGRYPWLDVVPRRRDLGSGQGTSALSTVLHAARAIVNAVDYLAVWRGLWWWRGVGGAASRGVRNGASPTVPTESEGVSSVSGDRQQHTDVAG